jgi:hypothetical protein
MLALNLILRDTIGLSRPLDLEQSAPVLYLWLSRAALVLGGVNEWMLRLVPVLSGVLLAWAVWSFARRLLSPPAALLATAIAALSPLAVWYANVAKPYAVDALVATLLLLTALRARESDRKAPWIALGLGGLLAPFLSAPAVFVLAGLLVAFLPARRMWTGRVGARYLAFAGCVAIGAGGNYLLFQRGVGGEAYLLRFYDRAFPWPPDASLPGRLSRLVSDFTQFFYYSRSIDIPAFILVATLAVAALGLWSLHRRFGWWWTGLCVTPGLVVVGAAVLHKYPPVERLLLFLTPLLAVITAAGVEFLVERLVPRRRSLAFAVVACAGLLVPAITDARNVLRPHGEGAEVRPMIAAYATGRESGDPVYIYARAVPIWGFYTTDWSHPDLLRLDELKSLAIRIGPNSGNSPSRGGPVQREGFDLVVRAGDHEEMVGTPSGVEILYGRSGRQEPDPGWADNEVEHIWVLLTHHSTQVEDQLQAAILRGGGRIEGDWRAWAARLWRIRFPRPGGPG